MKLLKCSQNWIRGSRIPIKSWINSLTPSDTSFKPSHVLEGSLNRKGYLKSVTANQIQWKKYGDYDHDGWLYIQNGRVNYIYDDFHTTLIGQFKNSELQSGHASKIIAYRCSKGIIELRFSRKVNSDVYSYEPISEDLPLNPTLQDPLEKNQLYLAPSGLPNMSFGEGLFAKRTIPGNKENGFATRHF